MRVEIHTSRRKWRKIIKPFVTEVATVADRHM
jgi:hypothetical protein